MAAIGGTVAQEHCGGFSFENCKRMVLFLGLIQEQQSCCGAGTAADTEYVTQLISSNIQLHSLSTGRQIPRLHKCCSCSGWCRLEWSNFTYSVPTWVMVHWLLCQCLSLDVNLTWNLMKLKKLVCDAIAAGIFNDLGSGSNVELCIVTKEDILTGEEQQASLLYIPFAFCCDKGHQTNCSGHDRNYRRGHGDVIYQLLCLPSFKI
ncbi:probable proteasome subunit beta type-2 isoform X7 [Acropora millepora]|uniref:probable proteasome subunit beta type-2 isoform X7 n=1 Tax=Acropora millepora TaxID=45264 RepID=UPI001CF2219E|nr:probable proteasome subunit beta type-2 isoform X7 [Acropora millepora]